MSSPRMEVEYSLSDFPTEIQDEVRVCGDRYVCTTKDQATFRWQRTEDPDVSGVTGCRVDSVLAAAAVNHCHTSLDQIGGSTLCRRKEPCLARSEGGALHCFQELGPGGSSGMPNVLDAGLQCVPTKPTPDSWETRRREWIPGDAKHGLMSLILEPKAPPPPTRRASSAPVEEAPPPTDFLPAAAQSLVPAGEPSLLPPAAVSPPSSAQKGGGVTAKCDWFQGADSLACNKDSDCPADVFDTWFDVTMSLINKENLSLTVDEFLNQARKKASYKAGLDWSPRRGSRYRLTPHEMNQKLEALHEEDDTFRRSVATIVRQDKTYRQTLEAATKGLCQSQRCTNGTPRPSVQLFNGTTDLTFVETDEGMKVRTKGGKHGQLTSVDVKSCSAPDAPRQCRQTNSRDVHTLITPTLSRTAPVTPYYRLNFSTDGHEYLLENAIRATGADDSEVKGRCAAALCDINSIECPAPHCFRDKGRCKPNADLVSTVELQ